MPSTFKKYPVSCFYVLGAKLQLTASEKSTTHPVKLLRRFCADEIVPIIKNAPHRSKKPIKLICQTDKGAYYPEQEGHLTINITNDSKKSISGITVRLHQKFKYQKSSSLFDSHKNSFGNTKLCTRQYFPLSRGTYDLDYLFRIPAEAFLLPSCSTQYFTLKYTLRVKVTMKNRFDVTIKVPINVGGSKEAIMTIDEKIKKANQDEERRIRDKERRKKEREVKKQSKESRKKEKEIKNSQKKEDDKKKKRKNPTTTMKKIPMTKPARTRRRTLP